MEPPISPLVFALLLFLGMLTLIETGRRLAIRRRSRESEGERSSLGTVEGAVFALFGLLMAFTFSGAAGRFNEKRMLIAEEVNCIETAYLRLHLVPRETELALQDLFRRYVDSRLETYHRLPNMQLAEEEMAKSKELQEEIWTQAVEATRLPTAHPDGGKLLLPALNNMIDIATTRTMALQIHPENLLCPSVRPWAHLFLAGRLSDGKRSTPELASHPRFHGQHGRHRLRRPRRRVPAHRSDPP